MVYVAYLVVSVTVENTVIPHVESLQTAKSFVYAAYEACATFNILKQLIIRHLFYILNR
jgi:hypothetical protein